MPERRHLSANGGRGAFCLQLGRGAPGKQGPAQRAGAARLVLGPVPGPLHVRVRTYKRTLTCTVRLYVQTTGAQVWRSLAGLAEPFRDDPGILLAGMAVNLLQGLAAVLSLFAFLVVKVLFEHELIEGLFVGVGGTHVHL